MYTKKRFLNPVGIKSRVSQKGFTLIELIIVMGVISVLFVALMSSLNPLEQFRKSRDTQRKASLAQVQRALEAYYQDHGSYPTSSGNYRIMSDASTTLAWGDTWAPYMDILPKDPKFPTLSYAYYSPDSQTYFLYASLERGKSDPSVCNAGAKCKDLPIAGQNACGSVCNFGVSSPNVKP